MDQPSTRTPRIPSGRPGAALPPQGGGRSSVGVPGQRPAARARLPRRLPGPRLTGLGGGLLSTTVMALIACLDVLVCDGSMVVYGVLFLPVATLTALYVRNADLVAAPVSAPLAFAIGVLPATESGGGFAGRLVGLFSALSLHAGWLYGGTLVAGAIVTVRKVRLMARRAAARRAAGARVPAGSRHPASQRTGAPRGAAYPPGRSRHPQGPPPPRRRTV